MVSMNFVLGLVLVATAAHALVTQPGLGELEEDVFVPLTFPDSPQSVAAWQRVGLSDRLVVAENSSQLQAPASSGSGPNFALKSSFAVTWTYFLNYLLLACVRTKNHIFYPTALPSANERILENVATFLVYVAPMLCVLFFEVVKLFELPPLWLNCAFVACSAAFCVQALAYIVSELYLKMVDSPYPEQQRVLYWVRFWRNICNFATAVQYVAIAIIICFGVGLGTVPLLVGHKCTLILTAIYMIVYLLLFIFRTHQPESSFFIEILKHATIAINFAPMLCVLCMGTQMAYELSGTDLAPDVAGWMVISTYSVLVQVLLVTLSPILANADLRVVGANGELDFVSEHNCVFVIFSFLRFLAMMVMFVGVCYLCMALWAANPPKPLKVSLFYFSCVYFVTYLALWFVIFTDGFCSRMMKVLKMVKDTVAFCPMLCVLFLSVFLQASQFGSTATPQSYSQDWMMVATAALLTQVLMICLAGLMVKGFGLGYVFLVCFHLAMLVTFVSIAVIAFGSFMINAGNANGDGAWFAQAS